MRCTGITASWCPRHGDCTCPPAEDRPSGEQQSLDHPNCPLHAPASTHGDDA